MLIEDFKYFERVKDLKNKTFAFDTPGKNNLTVHEWHSYPVQNFDYNFNNWGFRGPEYSEFIGKPVIICLGDSFTVNLGGPIKHSWASQLAKHFEYPVLNLGLNGAGNDALRLIYKRACNVFDVQDCFVMYSYLARRNINGTFTNYVDGNDDATNFEYFEQQRLDNVYESIIPYWCHSNTKIEYFKQKGLTFFSSKKDSKTFTNRDGHHMNELTNSWYADHFYNQWKQHNES